MILFLSVKMQLPWVDRRCFCFRARNGPWKKWASYGFTKDGLMVLEEYYPNALEEVYRGVSGYLYSVEETYACQPFDEIRDASIADVPLPVLACERIEDAYEVILQAESMGQLVLKRYHQLTEKDHIWLEKTIRREYEQAQDHADYRWFLQSKFSFLNPG